MKPTVNKLSCVPRTAVLCCPSCYRMISYNREQAVVECEACRVTVANPGGSSR